MTLTTAHVHDSDVDFVTTVDMDWHKIPYTEFVLSNTDKNVRSNGDIVYMSEYRHASTNTSADPVTIHIETIVDSPNKADPKVRCSFRLNTVFSETSDLTDVVEYGPFSAVMAFNYPRRLEGISNVSVKMLLSLMIGMYFGSTTTGAPSISMITKHRQGITAGLLGETQT